MLRLAYDGSRYCGWQRQPDQPTVQQELEEALLKLTGEERTVVASGRTDSGVHARGQVCHFDLGVTGIPFEKFTPALNRFLPPDIRILESRRAGEGFHARYSALRREYRYYLSRTGIPDPFSRPYCYAHSDIPSTALLDRYAALLPGERDFTTFSAAGDPSESKIRRIFAASVFPLGGFTVFRIVGNAFLWRMVRSIVGTMLELGRNGAPPEELSERIAARDRSAAGPTAPARGLFLHEVEYDERFSR
jgi:tRNA pseudouridine38-40 synthase